MRFEFYGVPRLRAGRAFLEISVESQSVTLAEALQRLAQACPDFATACMNNGSLLAGYVINLDGERFVQDPTTRVADTQTLIVMSSDAGG